MHIYCTVFNRLEVLGTTPFYAFKCVHSRWDYNSCLSLIKLTGPIAVFLFTLLVLYFYNGEYKRMNCDNVPADEREDTTMFCDYPPECGPLNPAVNCSSSTSNLERTETPNSQLFSGFHGTLDSRDDSDPSRSNETF